MNAIQTVAVALLALALPGVCGGAESQAQKPPADTIILTSVKPSAAAAPDEAGRPVRYGLTRADLKRIESTIADVRWADPMREIHQQAAYRGRRVEVRVVGCTRAYFERNRHLWIARGRFFSQRDADDHKNLVVIGQHTAQELFGEEDPIDKSVHLGRFYYKVVGVSEPPETSGAVGEAPENLEESHVVYMPLETMWARMGDLILRGRSGARVAEIVELSRITVSVGAVSEINTAADSIRSLLEKSHPIRDYSIVVSQDSSP